jgi:hypothetical protein
MTENLQLALPAKFYMRLSTFDSSATIKNQIKPSSYKKVKFGKLIEANSNLLSNPFIESQA